ncbi:MAG TPA: protein translocase subunit SecD [Jiangellales bacterium]|nr:protein translocase subunit SecD [Jiangellales bacterium]
MASTNAPRPWRSLAVIVAALALVYGLLAVQDLWLPRLGLDLRGGTSITLTASTPDGSDPSPDSIDQAVEIIRDRVNGSGVAEAEVSTQGSNNVIVAVPGVGEDELVQIVGQTAELRFRPVLAVVPGASPQESPTPEATPAPEGTGEPTAPTDQPTAAPTEAVGQRAVTSGLTAQETAAPVETPAAEAPPAEQPATEQPATEGALVADGQPTPEGLAQLQAFDCSQVEVAATDAPEDPLVTCDQDGTTRFLLAPADVVGTDIGRATAEIPQAGLGFVVSLDFTSEGADKFYESTQRLAGQQFPQNAFAIVLDGRVVSYPTVNEPIPGGQAVIEGQFTQQEAQRLATVLSYGALPLSFETSEVTTVSPTLGSEQLEAGLLAGALGLLLVSLYGLLYYRALGTVVIASLAVAGAFAYGLVVLLGEWIGFTLTLAGIAGLIVAIGITADSFVVYFERVRDDVRDGRSIRMAVETGWVRARRTILASDAVSLLAAFFLYTFSVGNVRGFAFTLGLTTLIDVFVVFLFTKPLLTLLARSRFFGEGHRFSGLAAERAAAPRRSGRAAPAPRDRAGTTTEEALR